MTVIDYVTEEVERQGHNTRMLDGISRVGWMLNAWEYALERQTLDFTVDDICKMGRLIERGTNRNGFRRCDVWVGRQACPAFETIETSLTVLMERSGTMKPLDFYRAFEEIHPFGDGNGRTGKVLLNWLNGTLLDPIFPPSEFWGRPIRNP